jgi:8-oxo-dGTP pyrophosphatase MutT (NUDIX family)
MPAIENIRRQLAAHQPRLAEPGEYPGHRHAAVSLLLCTETPEVEILYLQRSSHDGDPWSGDLGFPGGHIDCADNSAQQAAERETQEEIGLSLAGAEHLGRLDDIAGAHLPIIVSCFVYSLPARPAMRLNNEVVEAFWIPLGTLLDPRRHVTTPVSFRNEELLRPAINLLGPGRRVLWGITYRLTVQFLDLLGHRLPPTPIP